MASARRRGVLLVNEGMVERSGDGVLLFRRGVWRGAEGDCSLSPDAVALAVEESRTAQTRTPFAVE